MWLFSKKNIYDYNILEKYKINLEQFIEKNPDYCVKIDENDKYVFYKYRPLDIYSNKSYVLRKRKNGNKDIVFFGEYNTHC